MLEILRVPPGRLLDAGSNDQLSKIKLMRANNVDIATRTPHDIILLRIKTGDEEFNA